jgi:signal transduction histidine kinase
MDVASASARCFSARDVQLLQRAGDRIALSIDRARLFDDERRARREAEAAHAVAARQASELDRVFEAMADAVVIHNEQGQIVKTNAAARRLLGLHAAPPGFYSLSFGERMAFYDPHDCQGRPITLENNPSARTLRGEVLTEAAAVDFRMRSLDGRDLDVNFSATPLRNGEGRIVGAVNILRDQTERHRLEREREEASTRELALRETNERLETYVAMAAHDLRSPLAISRMQVEATRHLLLKKAEQTRRSSGAQFEMFTQVATAVESVQQNIDRLWRLVQQLMDAARARAGILVLERRPVQLDALVRDCIEDLRLLTPSRPLILDLPAPGPVAVDADPDRVGQVVSNLLSNAARYSDEESPIRVALRVVGSTHRAVRVQVRDHGVGIPEEEQATIWERYQRARTQQEATGLGLGLYIVRTIVELHGGRVGLKSAPGKGSTFWFTLPLESAAS